MFGGQSVNFREGYMYKYTFQSVHGCQSMITWWLRLVCFCPINFWEGHLWPTTREAWHHAAESHSLAEQGIQCLGFNQNHPWFPHIYSRNMDLRKDSETTTALKGLVELILTYIFWVECFCRNWFKKPWQYFQFYSDLFLHQATQGGFQLSTSPYNKNAWKTRKKELFTWKNFDSKEITIFFRSSKDCFFLATKRRCVLERQGRKQMLQKPTLEVLIHNESDESKRFSWNQVF